MTKRKRQVTPVDPAVLSLNIITMLLASDDPASWAESVDRELEGLDVVTQKKVLAMLAGHQMAVMHAMQQLPGMREITQAVAAQFLQQLIEVGTEGTQHGSPRK